MEILDHRRRSGALEPPQALLGLFTRRNAGDTEAQRAVEDEWALISQAFGRDADATEAAAIAEEKRSDRTVLGPDEVGLENISMALARGPVVIQATDEQARQIVERHRRDAFRPE